MSLLILMALNCFCVMFLNKKDQTVAVVNCFGVWSAFSLMYWGGSGVSRESLSELFCVDIYSSSMVSLSLWICGISILVSSAMLNLRGVFNSFWILVTLLCFMLVQCFMVNTLAMFYVLFESTLVPMVSIIGIWGGQVDRIPSIQYMAAYTVGGSFPLLLIFMSMELNGGSSFMWFISAKTDYSWMFWTGCFLGFLVKLPSFPFHTWLPKAHVQAPVGGSVILAGILLKLGGYGITRVMMIFSYTLESFGIYAMSLSLYGSVYGALMCLRQSDVKKLIAYSSVSHMAFAIIGLFSCSEVGLVGAYIMLVSHGFISPGLFVLCGINSELVHSRKIKAMNDGVRAVPSLGLFWLVMIMANLGVPPCPVIISEVLTVVCVVATFPWAFILLVFYFILSGAYSFSLYSQLTRTKNKPKTSVLFNEVTLKDMKALYFLFYPLAEVLFKWDLWAVV
uniref:NADH-ubiquinone oxidoreductase chain 4 n=1 Tax=Crassostrea sikamea TaxID=94324 RepID=D5FRU9_CRASI|nr:NADH dehydrogenase subunit 4 [Crassostrea sikamea]ACD35442.1 NADH dehydrogenase subunit 4 [Crassostrea sikamea]ACO40209.1 NADH dehydrogenase subunit 4 [Crassostrea sikamea]AIM52377.1 NADH dehydrogenase subunit 4 [Crassostrea sikamea]AIM52390.1 NADH dehydrogenase subunit 4 [Crassostrea sikamea]AIM52403.1 NADH dehydrogenase subunit 4 [Crassostrea sikamea]